MTPAAPCGVTRTGPCLLHALRRRGRALQGTYTGDDGEDATWMTSGKAPAAINTFTGTGADDLFYGGDAGVGKAIGSWGGDVFNTFKVCETPPAPASLSVPLRASVVGDWRTNCTHAMGAAPATLHTEWQTTVRRSTWTC